MRTQPVDTRPEAERVLIGLIRKAPITKRFDLARSLTTSTIWSNQQNIRRLHPNISDEEVAELFVSHHYGQALANGLRAALRKTEAKAFETYDPLAAMASMVEIFEQRGVSYYIGGSVAITIYGMQRSILNVDLVADLRLEHFFPLTEQLEAEVENSRPYCIVSPEDIILTQLEHYKVRGEIADDQWNDILGILKVQGTALDLAYLQQWANSLKVSALLERACIDAGLKEGF